MQRRPTIGGHGQAALGLRRTRARFVEELRTHGNLTVRQPVAANRGLDRHAPQVALELFRVHVHAVAIQTDRLRDLEVDVAVDARALVPPALVLVGLDMHGQHVVCAVLDHVGQIHLEGIVAAVVVQHAAAVEVDGRVDAHALEIDHDALVPFRRVQGEMAAVPGVFVPEIAQRLVVFAPGLLRNDVVVRQIDVRPGLVADQAVLGVILAPVQVFAGGRAGSLALGLGLDVHRGLELGLRHLDLAQVELPALVQANGLSHVFPSQNCDCLRL